MLKKCWHKNAVSGNIELLKGWSVLGHDEYGKEPYCEYYMAQIAATLGFEHVPYDLPILDCLDENSLKELFKERNKNKMVQTIVGIYEKEKFQDPLLFDALTFNTDRHLGNFGMLIDNDTNELARPAPIFDNGMAFFNHITEYDLENIPAYFTDERSALGMGFARQLEIACQPRHTESLLKLANFTFTRHKQYNLPEKWLQAGEKFIQQRSQEIIQIIAKKQTKPLEIRPHSRDFSMQPTPNSPALLKSRRR
ncbi:hypothetical protein ACFOPX_06710 [Helicobacter baculiformis]|uniref:HipA-like C-terminal domain-containing protein n=1 Tax=Helicobacter baculiformis TaxID=427351 RepID=A0ABV7ZJI3_9HELI|nr:hypothetical protein [Helicobacter baculiformis]